MMEFLLTAQQRAYRRMLASEDGQFFLAERRRLLQIPAMAKWSQANTVFTILQAVILLRGLKQKEQVDHYLKQQGQSSIQTHGRIKHHLIRDRFLQDVRFVYQIHDGNQTIVLPFFNRAMNFIYHQEPDKLFDYPYSQLEADFTTSIIDAFEHYHHLLYASNFTSLVPLDIGDRSSKAYYQTEARTVFIINQQGRLDVSMLLFDRALKKPNLIDVPARLKKALPYYFANDRTALINQLAQEELLSKSFAKTMLAKKNSSIIRREKE